MDLSTFAESYALACAEQDRRCVEYREAKASVSEHLRRMAEAELALAAWLKAHRAVPANRLYDAKGDPVDPEHGALEESVDRAFADVAWCRALVVACGEVVKGRPFDEVVASQCPRPTVKVV